MRTMLHIGCAQDPLPDWAGECKEVRLDIDPEHNPDIVASMLDMGDIGTYDGIYTCHSLEHVYPHEVPIALSEFYRVLNKDGVAIIIVPDLEGVKANEDMVYMSEAGPVCGLDIMYGMARLIALNPYMAHHCGFTADTLSEAMRTAGFTSVSGTRLTHNRSIMVTGKKEN